MDYEYYYNNAKSKYYNACSEVSSCQNRINDLKNQKQQKVTQINELVTEINSHEAAYDQMTTILKSKDDLNTKLLDISDKVSSAAVNYTGMVDSSDVTSKNLTDVYSDEMSQTKLTLENILDSLTAKNSSLSVEIAELKSQLKTAESELEDIKNGIRNTESSLSDWQKNKSNAAYDMEYYRRKMQEAI